MGAYGDAYRRARQRITELVGRLDADDAARPVPACPGWTVKDVVAHLAGATADIENGVLDGVATEPWTRAQVEARRNHSLADVLAEWSDRGPRIEEIADAFPPPYNAMLVADVTAHEQDIRGALGQPGGRDDPSLDVVLDGFVETFAGRVREAGLPAVRLVADGREWRAGEGEPVVTLKAEPFELLRTLLGRRSRAQAGALQWDGDAAPYLDVLPQFTYAEHDIVE